MMTMKGFVQTEGKVLDLETGKELEIKTFIHSTMGEVKYVGLLTECVDCDGTGLLNEEECSTCQGIGAIQTGEEFAISIEHSEDENGFMNTELITGWKESGGEE